MRFSWLTKYIYLIVVGFMAITLITLSVFLYRNFYQTITHSKRIIVLRQEVAFHTIDLDFFNEVVSKIEEKSKKETAEWQKLKNPFGSY